MKTAEDKFKNSIGMQLQFYTHSGLSMEDTIKHIYEKALEFTSQQPPVKCEFEKVLHKEMDSIKGQFGENGPYRLLERMLYEYRQLSPEKKEEERSEVKEAIAKIIFGIECYESYGVPGISKEEKEETINKILSVVSTIIPVSSPTLREETAGWLKLKEQLILHFEHKAENGDEVIIVSSLNNYSAKDLVYEIRNNTEFGIKQINGMVMLALDLIERGKEKLTTTPYISPPSKEQKAEPEMKELSEITDVEYIEIAEFNNNRADQYHDRKNALIRIGKNIVQNQTRDIKWMTSILYQYLKSKGYKLPVYFSEKKELKKGEGNGTN